eukprot:CAMPEP_0181505256 /NCGR_PEP_ID=MMETSP1110-20121109/57959_1 /TAXON_ID=174948 /ORGANISM="Symbiodinium sp., Strain CCMP421" /LENGTH=139 /DNA_ID=CAMNT_0023634225 /DNA_START=388 /DNA_END=808 /DNA_ORIENTATION=-
MPSSKLHYMQLREDALQSLRKGAVIQDGVEIHGQKSRYSKCPPRPTRQVDRPPIVATHVLPGQLCTVGKHGIIRDFDAELPDGHAGHDQGTQSGPRLRDLHDVKQRQKSDGNNENVACCTEYLDFVLARVENARAKMEA